MAIVDIARLVHQHGQEEAVWGVFGAYSKVLVLVGSDNFDPQLQRLRQITSVEMVKTPIQPTELVSKLSLLKKPFLNSRECIEYHGVQMDLSTIRAYRNGRRLKISILEYKILNLFIEQPERVFSRSEIIGMIWPDQLYVQPRTVDVHIGRLRKALNEGGAADLIRTVRSCGYALDPQT